MTKVLIFCFFLLLSLPGFSQSKNELEIRQMLQAQTQAWNNGDIDAFMKPYWKSDSLIFVGKNGVTRGWQNTLNNYKKAYPDKTAMGQLKFDIIKIESLSTNVYNVVGHWNLTRTIGNLEGHYTLIIRKIKNIWCIVQDHSS